MEAVAMDRVMRLASERAVVMFGVSSCCMCRAVRALFCEIGVDVVVYHLDEMGAMGREMERALTKCLGREPPVPAVFVGGRLVGSTERVMSLHLGGSLVPLLRGAGALWL